MASVINSARTSTASIFNVVGTTADAATQLINTGSRAIDMLDRKTKLMHARVVHNTEAQVSIIKDQEQMKAASEQADFMEEIQRKNYADDNRKQLFESALQAIQAQSTET